jgi:predicted AAA+ superfamily ATPase
MIAREAEKDLLVLMQEFPAVAILGPRQVGKTTLAEQIAKHINPEPLYLDLENPSDLAKLTNAETYFDLHADKLVILDEVQRAPGVFQVLRGVIDRRRRSGQRSQQFLILGSASLDLLQQSSETLAGRIAYEELTGFNIAEVEPAQPGSIERLWSRGGFPDSFLATSEDSSTRWRQNFISTYLERDIPQFGTRIPAVTIRRLWTMLAHDQGGMVNVSKLGAALDLSSVTAKRYLELLEDLLLIRSLRPWSGNIGKRLVKAPKVYIRDSGLVHTLLNLKTMDDVLGHPVSGASWEGFVIENLISALPVGSTPWFYRTSAGAEIDLVIETGATKRVAIEIKRSMAPKLSKGFYQGCVDIGAARRFVVYPGSERFSLGNETEAISILELMHELKT